jgi:hypothetical protein
MFVLNREKKGAARTKESLLFLVKTLAPSRSGLFASRDSPDPVVPVFPGFPGHPYFVLRFTIYALRFRQLKTPPGDYPKSGCNAFGFER